ncbi:MAG: ATP-binding protein [Eubacteriales bacterium]|nr:ATP-binding protein [Eubacteriales bacterium]
MTIKEILAGESRNVEFKVQRLDKSIKYMKSVVAFANGKGGRILFGVDDKTRDVVGIPEEEVFQEIDAITNAISDSCEPAIIPDVYLQTIDGKTIIVAEIGAGRQKPYYIKADGMEKGVYIRVSGTTRLADREISRELYYECDGRSYDSVMRTDFEVSDEDIQNLCRQMKEVALANSKSDIQREAVKDVTKNVLLSWGILKKSDGGKIYPTNAYVYLTGQDSFHSRIQCGVFKGTTRSVFVDKRDYDGPLWEQVDNALKFVLRNICLGSRLEGVYRQDIYELPPDGIRELLINAVMNCSFIQASHIQVALYDDRLEITSPGGLLPGVTIELMKEGFSKIRNRALANAFAYMNLVEAWGSGIPKLLQAMSEYGLREPEFIDMEVAFRINLYRKRSNEQISTHGIDLLQQDFDGTKDAGKVPINEQEQRIYEFVLKYGAITTAQVMELLGIKQRRARNILAKMVSDHWLKKEGASRSTVYTITTKA